MKRSSLMVSVPALGALALLLVGGVAVAESMAPTPPAKIAPAPAAAPAAEPPPAAPAADAPKPSEPKPLAIGDAMPLLPWKMKNVDGKEITLADAMGKKGTLVIFTCNHCPYVKLYDERIAALGNEYLGKGFGVVAINPNDPNHSAEDGFDGMVERAKKLGLKYPYVVDATSNVARVFGAKRTPEVFLFDGSGKLVYKGAVDDNAKDPAAVKATYLKDAMEAVLAGKPVAEAETKAVGCGIKFRPSK